MDSMSRRLHCLPLASSPLLLLGVFAAALTGAVGTGCQVAPAATVDHGAYLFSNYCAQCHGNAGQGSKEAIGAPSIAGLPKYYVLEQLHKYRSGVRGAHFDDAEGLRMRPMSLTLGTETDVEAVAMYVASLTPAPPPPTIQGGDAAKGKEQFADCVACHGADAMGMEAVGSPPLVYQPDWYIARQIGKFKAGIRGANKKDAKGLTMAPMAGKLEDDQAVKDAVAYIITLRK